MRLSREERREYQQNACDALRDADAFCPGRSEAGGYCSH